MLWWRPPLQGDVVLAIYYAVVYVLFDAAATFVYMPYYSLTPELTSDYDERTSLTSYRMFFSIVASLVAFTVPLVIIGNFSAENASKVWLMGAIFGAVSAAPLLLVFAGTRERTDHMHLEQPSLRDSLKAAAKNKPFLFAAGIFLLTWVTIDILQTTLLYFIKYIVRLEDQSDLIMSAIFITAMLFLPFWNWVSKRWSKRQAYIAGIAFLAVVLIVLIMLNGSTPQTLIYVICILAGVGVGAAHVLPWAIMPDTMEYDEWQSGERHEGMLYSLVTLMQKVASSIAIPLVLLLLDKTGYVPNSSVQPASALLGIRIVIGPIAALLLLIAIFLAIRYPLNREFFARIMKDLEKKHAEIK
jgi:glycoside/pentoside/hexuronide:cation symporter, GPH family